MAEVDSIQEINRIRVVIDNFDWKITKQVITDEALVLTIEKDLIPNKDLVKPSID